MSMGELGQVVRDLWKPKLEGWRGVRSRRAIWRSISVVVCASAWLVACGGEDRLSASSTCEEYLSRSEPERSDAAVRISTEIEGISGRGNPMWSRSLDAACRVAPSMTLDQAFSGGGFGASDDGSGEAEGSDSVGLSDEAGTPGLEPERGSYQIVKCTEFLALPASQQEEIAQGAATELEVEYPGLEAVRSHCEDNSIKEIGEATLSLVDVAEPTPGPDGEASQETVAAVRAVSPPLLAERIYGVFWDGGSLLLDIAPAMTSEARVVCDEIRAATGATEVAVVDTNVDTQETLC